MKRRYMVIIIMSTWIVLAVGCNKSVSAEETTVEERIKMTAESIERCAEEGCDIALEERSKILQEQLRLMSRKEIENMPADLLKELGELVYAGNIHDIIKPLDVQGEINSRVDVNFERSAIDREEAHQMLLEEYTNNRSSYSLNNISERIKLMCEGQQYWIYCYEENTNTFCYDLIFKKTYYDAETGTVNCELTEENIKEFFSVYRRGRGPGGGGYTIADFVEETENKYLYIFYEVDAENIEDFTIDIFDGSTNLTKTYGEVNIERYVCSIDKVTKTISIENNMYDIISYYPYDTKPTVGMKEILINTNDI